MAKKVFFFGLQLEDQFSDDAQAAMPELIKSWNDGHRHQFKPTGRPDSYQVEFDTDTDGEYGELKALLARFQEQKGVLSSAGDYTTS